MIVVPTSLAAGVVTSLYRGRRLDWIITTLGSSLATVPEFVSGTILIVVFALGLKWLPVEAEAQGSFGSRLVSLLLPALSLDGVIFGYILRVARAGMVDALESDYVRTATLKGLPRWQVVRRHVLRNALSPAVTVIATEVSFLIGGLVVIETLFNYPGLGRLIYQAAQYKDFPMLEAGVLVIGVVFVLGTLIADVLYVVLNPRVRFEASD
ncbi:ABC transporter permease [Conexibacter sp. S30A1]|uniref:ABC transporter permease n=1 Tax=Conexibacter sp. S30A1 TaxID=2937800 RepID=UPI00200F7B0B|nr:ABC transporter permease [Conexibacter sp. S30A1]